MSPSTSMLPARCGSDSVEPAWERRRLRVPREDRRLLAIPSLSEAIADVDDNAECLDQADCDILGTPLPEIRRAARSAIVDLAAEYTRSLGVDSDGGSAIDIGTVADPHRIILGGHQPELFHTGVWIKNFAISRIAAATGAVAINLIVDNDLAGERGVRVPRGNRDSVSTEVIRFDEPSETKSATSWEECRVHDVNVFRTFADRVTTAMCDWSIDPSLVRGWPRAVRKLEATGDLVAALTCARVALEREFGVANLELPMSQLCGDSTFSLFAAHVLAHLPRFRDVHDSVLNEYRQVNRIRSTSRPISNLEERDGWLEAPFWMWTADNLNRRPLFARYIDGRLQLSDGESPVAELTSPLDDPDACVQQLGELARRGVKIRTRALTTTLFTRLVLGDLFVHGIGGSKYDEVTDRIIWRFFKIPPPAYATISATLHLPIAQPHNATITDQLRIEQQLRDLEWNPNRHLDRESLPAEVVALIDEKQRLIADQHAAIAAKRRSTNRLENWRSNLARRSRFQQIGQSLQPHVQSQRESLTAELAAIHRRIAANDVLTDREFSFCLYPIETLHACDELLVDATP